jgi:hypothetical protein
MEIIIDKELIQQDAETILDRQLTDEEFEDVHSAILERVSEVVQDGIHHVIDFNEMIERNIGAEKSLPHYRFLHKNDNAYQPDFRAVGTFKDEKDARQYVHHDFTTEFDQWKVVQVDKDGSERDVYKVHC